MSDAIAIRNGKFARLNERPVFFFTETRTITFDFPQGYSYSQDDEYELSLDVDADVDTGPMLRVFGSVDTENRKVTFVLPFYGDEVKERINGRDSSVMLVIQLARVSNTTGVRHILLHDTVLCIPAVDDGGDGSEVLPDAEQQPANAHYTVQELDDLLATAPLFQFSADGEEWHDEQDEDDVFIRFSNAETREVHWSGPIRFMPADFAEYVQRARQAALDAEAGATLAESWAVGNTNTRTGEDTDNSKYYSEQSAAQASNASNSASTATAKATLAESYARGGTGTRSGEDADNAKYYKEQAVTSAQSADANAVLAESYARGGTGTRSGEDADNAKYYNTGAEDARDGANDAQTLAETAQAAAESAAGNAAAATGAAITAQFSEALSKVAGQVTAAQASANAASASQVSAAGDASKSNVWAEGTDAQVEALGGEHSAKRWAEIGGGGGSWGSITGDISSQTDLADALDGKVDRLNDSGIVSPAYIDIGGNSYKSSGNDGGWVSIGRANKLGRWYCLAVGYLNDRNGKEKVILLGDNLKAGASGSVTAGKYNSPIDAPLTIGGGSSNDERRNIFEFDWNGNGYAAGGIQQGITAISSATSSYALSEGCFSHAPEAAPTYVFPTVADSTRTHRITLIIDFSTIQTYAFEDSEGNALLPLFTPTISAGDVYEFDCEYSAVKSQWLIWPHKQGSVSDDYVMQSQVGAANGVAGLDANGKILTGELPVAGTSKLGVVQAAHGWGVSVNGSGYLQIVGAGDGAINNRSGIAPIIPTSLNYAVIAALTDSHKIQLTDAQKASAQDTLGIGAAPIIGTTAPTTSTAGSVGQLYVDTTTSKTYHCTAATNTGTEAEPAWSYMWVDDINAKGGTFDSLIAGKNLIFGAGGSAVTYAAVIAQNSCIAGEIYSLAMGIRNETNQQGQFVCGRDCTRTNDTFLSVGGNSGSAYNFLETNIYNGVTYLYNGMQNAIHEIPSATSMYMLSEGTFTHNPSSAPTYTLPQPETRIVADKWYLERYPQSDGSGYHAWKRVSSGTYMRYTASATPAVGDNTYTNTALTSGAKAVTAIDERTHECILTVRFSSSVLTYAFEDSAGNPITPLPLAGTIEDGSVVCFRCTWEALLNSWVIQPKLLNPNA